MLNIQTQSLVKFVYNRYVMYCIDFKFKFPLRRILNLNYEYGNNIYFTNFKFKNTQIFILKHILFYFILYHKKMFTGRKVYFYIL